MKKVQISVSDLTAEILDYWVAKAEGFKNVMHPDDAPIQQCFVDGAVYSPFYYDDHADPIIKRERIDIVGLAGTHAFQARCPGGDWFQAGGEFGANTAAMRAYVSSKFGDFVSNKQ